SVLHMLRFLIGDELFRRSVRHYGERHKYGLAETSDFARAVKETTGENLDWFFEQWIYLAGHPKLLVTKTWDQEKSTLELRIDQTQDTSDMTPFFRLPMDIEITCPEKTEVYRVVVDDQSQDFYFNLPSKPLMVIVDKGDWILKTLDFDKSTEELRYQLRNGDTMARVRAARGLAGGSEQAEAVAALSDVLGADGFWGVRREVAIALGAIKGHDAQRALLEGLKAKDARVRLACAKALGNFDKAAELERDLLAAFRDDFAYEVRAAALGSLVEMKSKRAKAACLEALKVDSDRGVIRRAGLTGLIDLKASEEIDQVEALARKGNRRTYRHAAITAYADLAKQLDREGAREKAADFLCDMLDDWYLRTRTTVITALGTLGEKHALDELRRVAGTDPVESIRARAARTAGSIETKAKAVADTDELREEIRALGQKLDALKAELRTLQATVPRTPSDEKVSRRRGEE
ncbi:MAG: HEAT repeat domain-containing protein, partial [Candidatus Krumholzibacteria bacterium]|nr:HEAT repeat domain-containing protein [Candidatus Krumholzibacteria bacterium]